MRWSSPHTLALGIYCFSRQGPFPERYTDSMLTECMKDVCSFECPSLCGSPLYLKVEACCQDGMVNFPERAVQHWGPMYIHAP